MTSLNESLLFSGESSRIDELLIEWAALPAQWCQPAWWEHPALSAVQSLLEQVLETLPGVTVETVAWEVHVPLAGGFTTRVYGVHPEQVRERFAERLSSLHACPDAASAEVLLETWRRDAEDRRATPTAGTRSWQTLAARNTKASESLSEQPYPSGVHEPEESRSTVSHRYDGSSAPPATSDSAPHISTRVQTVVEVLDVWIERLEGIGSGLAGQMIRADAARLRALRSELAAGNEADAVSRLHAFRGGAPALQRMIAQLVTQLEE